MILRARFERWGSFEKLGSYTCTWRSTKWREIELLETFYPFQKTVWGGQGKFGSKEPYHSALQFLAML